MSELADFLQKEPPLEWIIGTVADIPAGGRGFTMTWKGGTLYNVSSMAHYTPVIGQTVHVLSWPPNGMIAIGSGGVTPAAPAEDVPVLTIYNALSGWTYGPLDSQWTATVLNQSPTTAATWLYNGTPWANLGGTSLASFEIEITRLSGGPPEFLLHGNTAASGLLNIIDPKTFVGPVTTVGVATWVPLPIGWGEDLYYNQGGGISIGLGDNTGEYSGTGRLRFGAI